MLLPYVPAVLYSTTKTRLLQPRPTHRSPVFLSTHPAEKIITASNACGVNVTNLQIGQELCLPGYIVARCQYVLRTGEHLKA